MFLECEEKGLKKIMKTHGIVVAVTGANGFIASEVTHQLLIRGYRYIWGGAMPPMDERGAMPPYI